MSRGARVENIRRVWLDEKPEMANGNEDVLTLSEVNNLERYGFGIRKKCWVYTQSTEAYISPFMVCLRWHRVYYQSMTLA